jgi:hypothetical protein
MTDCVWLCGGSTPELCGPLGEWGRKLSGNNYTTACIGAKKKIQEVKKNINHVPRKAK